MASTMPHLAPSIARVKVRSPRKTAASWAANGQMTRWTAWARLFIRLGASIRVNLSTDILRAREHTPGQTARPIAATSNDQSSTIRTVFSWTPTAKRGLADFRETRLKNSNLNLTCEYILMNAYYWNKIEFLIQKYGMQFILHFLFCPTV